MTDQEIVAAFDVKIAELQERLGKLVAGRALFSDIPPSPILTFPAKEPPASQARRRKQNPARGETVVHPAEPAPPQTSADRHRKIRTDIGGEHKRECFRVDGIDCNGAEEVCRRFELSSSGFSTRNAASKREGKTKFEMDGHRIIRFADGFGAVRPDDGSDDVADGTPPGPQPLRAR